METCWYDVQGFLHALETGKTKNSKAKLDYFSLSLTDNFLIEKYMQITYYMGKFRKPGDLENAAR